MATVSHRKVVDEIIEGNGLYNGDPPCLFIVEYKNAYDGGLAWGLCYTEQDRENYFTSPFCHKPREIFRMGFYD